MKHSTQIKFFFDRWVTPSYKLFSYNENNICKEFSINRHQNIRVYTGYLRTFNYGEM